MVKTADMRDIVGFPDYAISMDGKHVYNNCTNTYLKQYHHFAGYQAVVLHKDGLRDARLVHRLVVSAAMGEDIGNRVVNFIDGDRQNPAMTNLEVDSV